MDLTLVLFLLGIVGSIVGWLLSNKDKQQARQIEGMEAQITTLFRKHDDDVQALQDLRERIAGRHYERQELDAKFDKLEVAFKNGFKELGDKFDKLYEGLMSCHNRSVDK